MTDSGQPLGGNAPGELSPDGKWVWDGHAWEPSTSSDGHWRWDGHTWLPLTPEAQAMVIAAGGQSMFEVRDIDDPGQFASGSSPPKVDQLPSDPLFSAFGVAIGHGWLARRPIASWHLLRFDQVRTVATVPPSAFKEVEYSRSIVAPDPDVAVEDQSGCLLRIPVGKFDPPGRQAFGSQIPVATVVTPAAAGYLHDGQLPGQWGKSFQILGKRFG